MSLPIFLSPPPQSPFVLPSSLLPFSLFFSYLFNTTSFYLSLLPPSSTLTPRLPSSPNPPPPSLLYNILSLSPVCYFFTFTYISSSAFSFLTIFTSIAASFYKPRFISFHLFYVTFLLHFCLFPQSFLLLSLPFVLSPLPLTFLCLTP